MSKFGFDRKIAAWQSIKQHAMERVAIETQKHFVSNFDTESWNNAKWDALEPSTRTKQTADLPILNVTGKLKGAVADSIKSVTSSQVVMIADPIDNRGRSYADYHNEGTPFRLPQRSFMKQDDRLTKLQLRILEEETGKVWQVK